MRCMIQFGQIKLEMIETRTMGNISRDTDQGFNNVHGMCLKRGMYAGRYRSCAHLEPETTDMVALCHTLGEKWD